MHTVCCISLSLSLSKFYLASNNYLVHITRDKVICLVWHCNYKPYFVIIKGLMFKQFKECMV